MSTPRPPDFTRRPIRRPALVFVAVVVGVVLLSSCTAARSRRETMVVPQVSTGPVPTASGWRLIGGDEFDGTSVDTTKWGVYHSNYGADNGEQQCSTPNNVTVGGGIATIWSAKELVVCPDSGVAQYTSGFLGSRDAGRYYPLFSRIEARVQVVHGQGLWPAVWLRHRNGAGTAEVDIMEYFHAHEPGEFRQSLHFPDTPGYRYNWVRRSTAFEASTATPGWHTVAVQILPAGGNNVSFTFFVDNQVTYWVTVDGSSWMHSAPPDATWDIAVNQAVGGAWVGDPEGPLGWYRQLWLCSVTEASSPTGAPSGCPTVGENGQPIRLSSIATQAQPYRIDWVRVWAPT